jgi:PBSX family phage terminase large subunit
VTATLSPAQRASIRDSDARVNIWDGSIRSGKTVASIIRWLLFVREAPAGPLAMVGKTRDTLARNILDVIAEIAPGAAQYTRGSATATILGRLVHVLGANDAKAEGKIRGLTLAGCYGDELSLWPPGFFAQTLGRLSVPGAKLFGTTNPDSPSHWLKRDYLDRAADLGLARFRFRITDNPGLDPEYIAALEREYVGLWRRRFLDGEWVAAEGAIFDMFDPDRHVVDLVPGITRWVSAGVDYGTSNPFHAVLIGLGVDGVLYVASEWRYDGRASRRQLTDTEYAERLREWLAAPAPGLRDVRPPYLVVDPSAASFVAQLHRDRMRPYPADNSVLDGIRTVAALFASDRLRIARRCRYLIDEIPGYSWDDKAAEKGIDQPLKVADHGVDGLRYGTYTTRGTWRRHLAAA